MKGSWSTVKLDLYGLKFYYEHVLRKPWVAPGLIKPPKSQRLPNIITIDEAGRIFAEDVHHEILCERLCTEILQQEAHVPKVEIGDAASFRGHRKTKVLVELLGNLDVL